MLDAERGQYSKPKHRRRGLHDANVNDVISRERVSEAAPGIRKADPSSILLRKPEFCAIVDRSAERAHAPPGSQERKKDQEKISDLDSAVSR